MEHEEVRKYWEGFPEAPASDTFKWTDEHGFEHMTTIRSWSFAGLLDQITKAGNSIVGAGGKAANAVKEQPKTTIPLVDGAGVQVVDSSGMPAVVDLPQGTRLFTVKAFFHDKTKTGKDTLKVVTNEPPYDSKYGVNCFNGGPAGWKQWPEGVENKYAPTDGFRQVIIRDPEGEGKYPQIVDFR